MIGKILLGLFFVRVKGFIEDDVEVGRRHGRVQWSCERKVEEWTKTKMRALLGPIRDS